MNTVMKGQQVLERFSSCTALTILPAAGAKDFVQQAVDAGAKVAIIAGTCSTPEEKIAEAALEKLGVDSADRCLRRYAASTALLSESVGRTLLAPPGTSKLLVRLVMDCPDLIETTEQQALNTAQYLR